MPSISVLIAEDQAIWRDTCSRVLEEAENMTVLATVADGAAAVEAAQRLRPDVVLLDIKMPRLNGIQAAEAIRAALPQVGVVIFSHYAQRQYAEAFLRDGTAGKAYLLKTTINEPAELIRAIEVVADHGAILAPEIQDELIRLISAKPDAKFNSLTAREREVLGLMAEGYTNITIARKLSISERTVESHVNNIFNKLDLSAEVAHNPRVMAVLLFLHAAG